MSQEHSKVRELLQEERACCAVIAIRFWNTEHTIYKYKSKFEVDKNRAVKATVSHSLLIAIASSSPSS